MQPADADAQNGSPALHNPGRPFDAVWLESLVRETDEDVERRLQRIEAAAAAPSDGEAPGLLRTVRCIDLTTLADDDTEVRVRALAARALRPVPDVDVQVAAVCVYTPFVVAARDVLGESPVRTCTVAAGFPDGAGTLDERVAGIADARAAGAEEIDVVIRRALANAGAWQALYDEVRAFREACGSVPMKVILGTGELESPKTILCAGATALMAGADFLKTSTGKEEVNATLPAGLAMATAIRAYASETGFRAGLKPAGGISTPEQARAWLALLDHELGAGWDGPARFRFGASSLLDGLVRRLGEL